MKPPVKYISPLSVATDLEYNGTSNCIETGFFSKEFDFIL